MAKWFYLIDGQPAGPIESAALKQLATTGRLKPTDKVRRVDLQEWYEAKQVFGLFSTVQSQSATSTTSATTAPRRPTMARDNATGIDGTAAARISPSAGDPSGNAGDTTGMAAATKVVLLICVVLSLPIIGYFIWFVAFRDTWELDNVMRLTAQLTSADRLKQSDPFAAYKIYDEVLKETRDHKLKNDEFMQRLAEADKSRTVLHQQVQAKIQAEEAERQRQAELQLRQEAAEKQRIAQEERRKLAVEEARRIAEDERRAEQERREEAATIYRNAPPSARVALNAVKKIAARVEVGVNYGDYSSVVGDTWGDVKIFIESSEGKKLPDFAMLLTKAIADYKLALDIWRDKIKFPTLYEKKQSDVDALQQLCWVQADACIELAESLLESDDKVKAMEVVAEALSKAADLDAKWAKIQNDILGR
jgi:hypothetical protein